MKALLMGLLAVLATVFAGCGAVPGSNGIGNNGSENSSFSSNPQVSTSTGSSDPQTTTPTNNTNPGTTTPTTTPTTDPNTGVTTPTTTDPGTTPGTVTPVAPTVNGFAAQEVTVGATKFVVTLRNNDVYLTSIAVVDGTILHEEPILVTADYDECKGIVAMNGFVYLNCVQDTPVSGFPIPIASNSGDVYIIKVEAASNKKTASYHIGSNIPATGIAGHPASDTLYTVIGHEGGTSSLARYSSLGIQLSPKITDNPGGALGEQFIGPVIMGSDGVYVVGIALQNRGIPRILAVKQSFDLATRLATTKTEEYRPFSISADADNPTGAELSEDGKVLRVYAKIDVTTNIIFPKKVLLKFDASTLKFLSETNLSGT